VPQVSPAETKNETWEFHKHRSFHGPRSRNLRSLLTTEGKITVRLFETEAPITVKNFIALAEGAKEWTHPTTRAKSTSKLYDGTIFHRVIPDFMIQGGDPAGTGMGGPGYRFEDETKGSPHKFDKPGKLAMANSGPNTNGSQFFITLPHHLAHRQTHHLRRSRRRPEHRHQNLPRPAQRPGQAPQARRPGIRSHRARQLR
jgi:cyclophilin family peptidyl-prolyl cis-trans isomerase